MLRIDESVYQALEKWAADEFRSVNGQIEWIVHQQLRAAGRMKNADTEKSKQSKKGTPHVTEQKVSYTKGTVIVETSLGNIVIALNDSAAPKHSANFRKLAKEGYYDSTTFHRVIPGFMIQGGGYTAEMVEKGTRPPIQNEATNGLSNRRGTLAMARLQSARSATAQFYINLVNNPVLDHRGFSPGDFGYAVFGRVLEGMDVVDRIAMVKTGVKDGMENVPVVPVVIKSVTVK